MLISRLQDLTGERVKKPGLKAKYSEQQTENAFHFGTTCMGGTSEL